jgi:hypothetical protein
MGLGSMALETPARTKNTASAEMIVLFIFLSFRKVIALYCAVMGGNA